MPSSKGFLYEFRVRRVRRSFAHEKKAIYGPGDVAVFFKQLCNEYNREHFYTVYLDTKGGVLGYEEIAVGHQAGVDVFPAEVFRGAIIAGAFAVILVHNHPSGSLDPSQEDIELTRRLHAAGKLVGIQVLDHVIVAHKGNTSLAEHIQEFQK